MNALALIAHGSKKALSNEEFIKLVEDIKNKDTNFSDIKAAFLELANPSIQSVCEEFISKNVSKIFFYPYFLNSGKHVIIDLPNIIKELQKNNPSIEFILLEHFGKSSRISDIILDDISSSTI